LELTVIATFRASALLTFPEGEAATVTVGVTAPVTGEGGLPVEEFPPPQPAVRNRMNDRVPSIKVQRRVLISRLFIASLSRLSQLDDAE
jgi:hypothetical protein